MKKSLLSFLPFYFATMMPNRDVLGKILSCPAAQAERQKLNAVIFMGIMCDNIFRD
ncbi:MAG: hypothetical protein HWN69_03740 [Desulfobacterales bacterium]|nr:hypothetical protein [Desulfobacterales bacterium]